MGNTTNPSQIPYFNASQSTATSNVTGNGTVFTCIWNTLVAGSGYNTSTGVYTAPMAGYYCFNVFIAATGLTSSNTLAVITLVTTSASYTIDTLSMSTFRSAAGNASRSIAAVAYLNANDTASVTWQVSNGTKVVSFGSGSRFSAMRFYQ